MSATNLPKLSARYEDTLATAFSNTASSFTLSSGLDKAGNALSGIYGFVIDGGTAQEEFLYANVSTGVGTVIVRGCDPTIPTTNVPALQQAHRKGASIKISDYVLLGYIREMLNGNASFSLDNLLAYTSYILPTLATHIVSKQYVDNAISGANATASNTTGGTVKTDQAPNALPRVLNVLVQQQGTPGMTLKVLPFDFWQNEKAVNAAGGNTGTVTAPASNPRIDLIVVQSSDGTVQIRAGSENASPVTPTPTNGDIVLAEVFNRVGETSIKDNDDSTNGYIKKWLTPSIYRTDLVPSGAIHMYAGASAPNGWQFCNGAAVSRTTYATLFAAIGTAFGVGDGTTTFNLPDFRGRAPVGVGTGTGGGANGNGAPTGGAALSARALGDWTGEETHVLSTGEMPSHTHGLTGGLNAFPAGTGSGGATGGAFGATTAIGVSNAGSGTAHNNLQPITVVNFIIKN